MVGAAALVLGLTAAVQCARPTGPPRAGGAGQAGQPPAGKRGPPGFWYGTDSFPVTVSGSAPYSEPQIGGNTAAISA